MPPHWPGPPFWEPNFPTVPGTQYARHWERRQLTLPCPQDQPWDWNGSSKLSGFGTHLGVAKELVAKLIKNRDSPHATLLLVGTKEKP